MPTKLGPKTFGLCLALMGLMVAGAGLAQTATGAYWLVSGKKFTTLLPELAVQLENNHSVVLGTIGGVGIHILCTGAQFIGAHIDSIGGWLGKKKYTGCKVLRLIGGKAENLPSCAPPGGTFETFLQKGSIVGSTLVIEPSSGTLLATVNMTEECAFGEKITFSGYLVLEDSALSTNQVTHLFTTTSATKIYMNGNEANKVTIDRSEEVKLSGAHAGLTWSGQPV